MLAYRLISPASSGSIDTTLIISKAEYGHNYHKKRKHTPQENIHFPFP